MADPPPKNSPAVPRGIWQKSWWVAALLILIGLVVYHGTFSVPFVFDDEPVIKENPTILRLWPLTDVLSPPHGYGLTVEGRPLVNLSLALNHAIGGEKVAGYHAVNLAIHLGAALALFGLVRRSLLLPRFRERYSADIARLLAGMCALMWVVHPLQTEAVTYIVQRAESLMALCFILVFYGFIRSLDSPHSLAWKTLAVLSAFAGMASKEVMVSAPLLLVLFDRTLVSGTFAAGWRRHRGFYVALASSWLLLGCLLVSMGGKRGGSAGLGSEVNGLHYLFTQAKALVLYLKLTVWPHPLVFDYGTTLITSVEPIVIPGLICLALLVMAAIGVWKNSVGGFLGTAFFLILAPTSSIVPIATQTMAEHRMYLPLALVIVACVVTVHRWWGTRSFGVFIVVVAVLGVMTEHRNRDYATARCLWQDTVNKVPENARAHFNLGVAFGREGHPAEEMAEYRAALSCQPNYPEAYYNLGNMALKGGNEGAAFENYRMALRLRPSYAKAHYNLAMLSLQQGAVEQAEAELQAALRFNPYDAEAHSNLGSIYYQLGQFNKAATELLSAVKLRPNAQMVFNLGVIYREQGRRIEALQQFTRALELDPKFDAASQAKKDLLAPTEK